MGYSDEDVRALCREALADGWTHFKVKVGSAPDDDARRLRLVREEIGAGRTLMIDANQRWDVDEAIDSRPRAGAFNLWWIEEPTSPDDVLGHAAIARAVSRRIGVATGEHCANRILFKQLFQAEAIDFCQIDSCRLGGVNENLAVILMAAKFGVPVCPHAGGVGLCELVQHLSMFDYIAVSGRWTIASPNSSTTCTSISSIPSWYAGAGTWRRRSRDTASRSMKPVPHRLPLSRMARCGNPARRNILLSAQATNRAPARSFRHELSAIASLKTAAAFRDHLARCGIALDFDDRAAPARRIAAGAAARHRWRARRQPLLRSCRWKGGTARPTGGRAI